MGKHFCQCCDREFHVDEGALGEICTACWWEDDLLEEGGWSSANGATLEEWRRAWRQISKDAPAAPHHSLIEKIWEALAVHRDLSLPGL